MKKEQNTMEEQDLHFQTDQVGLLKAPITDAEWEEMQKWFDGAPLEPWPEDPDYFQEIWEQLEQMQ